MDTSSKECTVPLSPTNSANDVRISITKDLPENNVNTTTQLDDCQSGAEDDFMNPEQVEKESEVNRSFSDSSNVVQETVMKNFFRKSIVNINLDSIGLNNTSLVQRLLENAQAEVRTLRRNRRIQSMKLYRAKKRVKSSDSLIFHMK